MIDGIRLKVCGLTSIADADLAARSGADYLGFVLFPRSVRYIPLPEFQAFAGRLPDRPKVAVCVEPDAGELMLMRDDFDFFQIHFRHNVTLPTIAAWAKIVGLERLWLAPKLPPAEDIPAPVLRFAKFFLLDTFQTDGFGGSGRTSDWPKFARHRQAHPRHTWILAGGLSSDNIADAIRATNANVVDVNSGVERAPGMKDPEKLRAFCAALQGAKRE